MMGEHARSGMAYAGKVSQLITVALGLDNWNGELHYGERTPSISKTSSMRCDLTRRAPGTLSSALFWSATCATPPNLLTTAT